MTEDTQSLHPVRALLKQITDRTKFTRDQRVEASSKLVENLEVIDNLQELSGGWQELCDEIMLTLGVRVGPLELKKNIARAIGLIGGLTGWEYVGFVEWILKVIKGLHLKADDERSYLISAAASSTGPILAQCFPFNEKAARALITLALEKLEDNTVPKVHAALMDLCVAISQLSPSVADDHFEDMVDLTIGWLIDDTVSKSIHSKCEETLFGMAPSWLKRPDYANGLLQQFRQDIDADLADIVKGTLNRRKTRDALSRAASLIHNHAVIMRIYLDDPMQFHAFFNTAIEEGLKDFEKYAEILKTVPVNANKLFLMMVDCLELLVTLSGIFEKEMCTPLFRCAYHLAVRVLSYTWSPLVARTYIEWISRALATTDLTDHYDILQTLLVNEDNGSPAVLFEILGMPEVSTSAAALLVSMLAEKNISSLQTTYVAVVDNWQRYRASLESAHPNSNCFLTLTRALRRLALVKNSFIVMMLHPPLFGLLSGSIVEDTAFAIRNPREHSACLNLLYIHCESHEFFVTNSQILANASVSSPKHISNLNAGNAETQLDMLTDLLSLGDQLCPKSRSLVDDWISGLVTSFEKAAVPVIFGHAKFLKLKAALLTATVRDPTRCGRLDPALKTLQIYAPESEADADSLMVEVRPATGSLNQESAVALWRRVSNRVLISAGVSPKLMEKSGVQKKIVDHMFTADDFGLVMQFLLHRQIPVFQNSGTGWAKELMDQLSSMLIRDEQEMTLLERWRWALGQAANYCIENRMRTIYGGAMETFSEISKELNRLAKEVVSGNSSQKAVPEFKKPSGRREEAEENGVVDYTPQRALTDIEEWWRVRLLTEFFELLEKLMFYARSGTAFPICPTNDAAFNFFIQNLKACQEWLARTYLSVMALAYTAGSYAQVIRVGGAVFRDFETKQQAKTTSPEGVDAAQPRLSGTLLAATQWMIRAMVQLGDEESVIGIGKWLSRIVSGDLTWVFICADVAAARWEMAIGKLRQILLPVNEETPDSRFAREMMLHCIESIRLPELMNPTGCPLNLSVWTLMGSDSSSTFPDAPPGFDTRAFERCRDLCIFGKVEKVESAALPWNFLEKSKEAEHLLLTTMRRNEMTDIEYSFANEALAVFSQEGPSRLHTRLSIVETISRCISNRMFRKGSDLTEAHGAILAELDPVFILKNSAFDLGERLTLSRKMILWTERLASHASIESHIALARLARKRDNKLLSGVHLMKAASLSSTSETPFVAQTRIAVQGAKNLWDSATQEVRASHFVRLFGLATKTFDIDLMNRVSIPPPNVNNHIRALNGFTPNSVQNNHAATNGPFHLQQESLETVATAEASVLLSRWLLEDPQLVNHIPPELNQHPLMSQVSRGYHEFGFGDLAGGLLLHATKIAPSVTKAHQNLADWALAHAQEYGFVPERDAFIQYLAVYYPELEAPEWSDPLWIAVTTSNDLSSLMASVRKLFEGTFPNPSENLLRDENFTAVWTAQLARRRNLLSIGVNALFGTLNNASTESTGKQSIRSVQSCLRLLDLLVDQAELVDEPMKRGLSRMDKRQWVSLLPQLFARLTHPARLVRQTVVDLLMQIGRAAPHAIIYQVVVGASSQMLIDGDDVVEVYSNEGPDHRRERSLMWEGCRKMEQSLLQHYPALVTDVRVFVDELQKINLLPEERWAFVLANINQDMDKRLAHLRAESERTMKAEHLDEKERQEIVQEKTRLITTPVYRLLDDLYDRTFQESSMTSNEKAFVKQFGDQVRSTFAMSRENRHLPDKAWAPFKQLLALLIQRTSRRVIPILQLSEINDHLAKLNGSAVPMPGQEHRDYSQVVNVERLGKQVLVLPTKTRPKKLVFVGSDGKEQYFLFKGQEDLHLDERIMQLLNICNLLLRGSAITKSEWPHFEARHYAVTPLGARSGLIQWVTGCTPLFQLYRKWQTRSLAQKRAQNKNRDDASLAAVERPVEMYTKKLRAAFKEKGVPAEHVSERSRWPAAVLQDLMKEMIEETPRNLVSRELWMRSGCSDGWWRVTSRMARSTAVMSIIGAVLGLGDRHLDNLLVNLETGQLVHIDYNVCFDKGRQLRVPETVPFRLTQNMVQALGPTQVEGTYRESCEKTLTVLRDGRQTLINMLDAFVYDPLIDWANATDHLVMSAASVNVAVALAVYGTDSRVVEAKPLARQMFAVRLREYGFLWRANSAELAEALCNLTDVLRHEQNQLALAQNAWKDQGKLENSRDEAFQKFKAAIHGHHHLMKNFRPLLRALSTCDERFANYSRLYRESFADPVVYTHTALEANPPQLAMAVELLRNLDASMNSVYSDLLALREQPPVDAHKENVPKNITPPPGFEEVDLARNQKQEQNVYARGVSKKVEARLEGRIDANDPDRVYTPQEQVEQWIDASTSLANLALILLFRAQSAKADGNGMGGRDRIGQLRPPVRGASSGHRLHESPTNIHDPEYLERIVEK